MRTRAGVKQLLIGVAVGAFLAAPHSAAHDTAHLLQLLGTNACVDCDLTGVDLRYFDLTDADLRGADFSGALLSFTKLTRADLSGADLSGVLLEGAHLAGTQLIGADLTFADLRDADLTDADMTDCLGRGIPGAVAIDPLSHDNARWWAKQPELLKLRLGEGRVPSFGLLRRLAPNDQNTRPAMSPRFSSVPP